MLIVLDDVDYYDLGCYGSQVNQTPRLDTLAAEGMRFPSYYAASPICSPSRAGLLTGMNPASFGWTSVLNSHQLTDGSWTKPGRGLSSNLPALGQVFKDLGYSTAMVGKWHVGDLKSEYRPPTKGFKNRIQLGLGSVDAATGDGMYWGYNLLSGSVWTAMPHLGEPGADEHYQTHELTSQAINWIDAHHAGPFFLYFAPMSIHDPLHVPAGFDNSAHGFDLTTTRGMTSAMLSDLDSEIGRLVDFIESLGLGPDTLVMVVSDNGGISGPRSSPERTAAIRGFKCQLYEGGIREPMIVRWPGTVPAGTVNDTVCTAMDVLPTLASLVGAAIPPCQGRDLSPNLLTAAVTAAPPLYWVFPRFMTYADFAAAGANYELRDQWAVRSGKLKLVYGRDNQTGLYDVTLPSGEWANLAATYPDRQAKMLAAYQNWHKTVSKLAYTPIRDAATGVFQVPYEARLDFVDGDWTFSMDASAANLTQHTVLAARPNCWELTWQGDRVRLALYDDGPGTLSERAVHLYSNPLSDHQVHRISFTVYGQNWKGNRIVSLYVDGALHKRLLPDAYPPGRAFHAVPPSDAPISVGSTLEATRPFQGSVGAPRVHSMALSVSEL